MKIGDMVELSAYGKKRLYNHRLLSEDKVGLVIAAIATQPACPTWRVKWYPTGQTLCHDRIEIKIAKIKKKT